MGFHLGMEFLACFAVKKNAAPPETAPVCASGFAGVRRRISKGDVAFEETVATFATEAEAKACRDENRKDPAATPRWPDFDEYEVRPPKP